MKNKKEIHKRHLTIIGSKAHATHIRDEHDFYATEPKAVRLLLENENFSKEHSIWECACGQGHLSKEMQKMGYDVVSTDKFDRGYGYRWDFLEQTPSDMDYANIVTNPPFKSADLFVKKGMKILHKGKKLALFLPIRYLEGKARKELYKKYPPKTILVSSSRLNCAKQGDFETYNSSAVAYAWFVWEKGHTGKTIVKWIN